MVWAQYDRALLATACGLICSCSTGLCGFGGTIIFQMLWALLGLAGVDQAGDVRTATAALAFQEIFTCVYLLAKNRSRGDRPRMDVWAGLYPTLVGTLFLGNLLLVEMDSDALQLVLGLVFWSIGSFKFGRSVQLQRRTLRFLSGGRRRQRAEMKVNAVELHDMGALDPELAELESEEEPLPAHLAQSRAQQREDQEDPEEDPENPRQKHEGGEDVAESKDEDESEAKSGGAKKEGKNVKNKGKQGEELARAEAKMRGLLPKDHGSGDQVFAYNSKDDMLDEDGESWEEEEEGCFACCDCCGCCGWARRLGRFYARHRWVVNVSLATGLFAGFLGGLFGTGGPPIIVFFALLPGLTKTDMRATASFIDLTVFPFRLLFGILLGVMKSEEWLLYLGTGLGSLAGAVLGDLMHHLLPTESVLLLLMTFVLASSAMLCNPGNGTTFGWVVLPLFALVPILLGWLLYLRWKISTLRAPVSARELEEQERELAEAQAQQLQSRPRPRGRSDRKASL